MLDVNKIPSPILEDIAASLPPRFNGPEEIAMMSTTEALNAYLQYNGLIGWTNKILEAWNAINEAFVDDLPDSAFPITPALKPNKEEECGHGCTFDCRSHGCCRQ